MNALLYAAAASAFLLGLAHSYLGERYLLIRLFRRGNLPKLLGGTEFTKRTLRFAWHITSVMFCSFGAILLLLTRPQPILTPLTWILTITFGIMGAISLIASRGRHLSWIFFLFIAAVCGGLLFQGG
ncbi:MAG: hypothetical protein AAF604_22840 [Acidobacteriota bacterium]